MKLTRHVALILAFIMVMSIQLTAERKVSTGTNSNRKKITSSAGLSAKHKMKQRTYLNTQWMALGYNSLFGNPLVTADGSKLIDAGFTASIFKINSNKDKIIGWGMDPRRECSGNYQSETIESSEKLKTETSASISAEASVPGIVNFSASASWRKMVDKLNNQNKVINTSENKCSVFNADIEENNLPEFTNNFKDGLKTIENLKFGETTKYKFFEFINNFGTHFVSNMHFGSKVEYLSESKDSSHFENVENGSKFEVKADSDFLGFGGKFEISNDVTSQSQKDKKFSNRSVITLGTNLASDTKHDEWARQSENTPMPVQTKFSSILDLFKKYKKSTNGGFANELEAAYKAYCPYVKNDLKLSNVECGTQSPGAVKAVVKEKYTDKEFYEAEMKCPPGSALSLISFEWGHGKHLRRYRCIHSTSVSKKTCSNQEVEKKFVGTDPKMTDLVDLEIDCKNNDQVLTSLNIVKQVDRLKYKFTCCKASITQFDSPQFSLSVKVNSPDNILSIDQLEPLDTSRSFPAPFKKEEEDQTKERENLIRRRLIKKMKMIKTRFDQYAWLFTTGFLIAPSDDL